MKRKYKHRRVWKRFIHSLNTHTFITHQERKTNGSIFHVVTCFCACFIRAIIKIVGDLHWTKNAALHVAWNHLPNDHNPTKMDFKCTVVCTTVSAVVARDVWTTVDKHLCVYLSASKQTSNFDGLIYKDAGKADLQNCAPSQYLSLLKTVLYIIFQFQIDNYLQTVWFYTI